jgi:hypothetical protein
MRELKAAKNGGSFTCQARYRVMETTATSSSTTKSSPIPPSYRWITLRGRKCEMPNRKQTKCFVVTGRPFEVNTQLPLSRLVSVNHLVDDSLVFGTMSHEGLVLSAKALSSDVTDSSISNFAAMLEGHSLLDFIAMGNDKIRLLDRLRCVAEINMVFEVKDALDVVMVAPGVSYPLQARVHLVKVDDMHLLYQVSYGQGTVKDAEVNINNGAVTKQVLKGTRVFGGLGTDNVASLQFEKNRLESLNKRLREEIDSMMQATPKSKKRK